MKGTKECKGDRSSNQASGGTGGCGGSVTETGALLPRLHVKETKRVGPRAPPRNKMALYEQFTFPSNRYVPPSLPLPALKTPTTYGPQRSSYDCSMFYGPPPAIGVMPWMPWMPYSEMYTGSYFGGQPSVNGSSSSTVVDCEGDLGQASAVPADSGRPSSNAASHMSPWVSSHSNEKNVSSKKARSNNDRTVPVYTPPVASSSGPPTPVLGSNQLTARAGHQDKVDTASTTEPVSVSSDRHGETSASLATSRPNGGSHPSSGAPKGGKKADQFRKGGNKDQGDEDESELLESTIVEKERDSMTLQKSHPGHSDSHYSVAQYVLTQRKGSQADASSDVEGLKGRNSSGECLTGIEEDNRGQPSKVGHKARSTPHGAQALASALTTITAEETAKKENRRHDTGDQGSKKQTHESDLKSISSAGSGDDLEITSSAEVSEVSQSDEGLSDRAESDAGDASVFETDPGRVRHLLAPKDIVNAIGEQEFWRARKLILRQQKIFSAQLFELHRIVKVQQLLASSPMIEEMVISREGPAETSEPAQANHSQDVEKASKNTDAFVGNQGRQEDTTGKQPDNSGHSSTSDRMCDDPPAGNSETGQSEAGHVSAMLNVTPGASTASWGGAPYAKAGATNWFGGVPAAPNGAYMYQPYPGSFHASQVNNMVGYNGAYPVMCAPSAMELPPMAPYGVPRYEQQPMQDMYRYNSYQQWPTAVFCPAVPSNPGPSWCGVPQSMTFMNPAMRGPYGWCNDPAAGSHPSGPSNYVRPSPQNNARSMPSAFHPSSFVMHPPWADSSNGQQAGGEAERFQQQRQWPVPLETGQTTTPVFQKPRTYSSDQDCAQVGLQKEHAPFGACETSAPTFRKPMRDSTGQECEVSASQHAESGTNTGWRRYDGMYPRDSCGDPNEGSAADQYRYAGKPENLLKRSRGSRPEMEGAADKSGARHAFESRKPPGSEMDALPLFPLGPALNGLEGGRPGAHSSSGVIKAVPRAMVASAESTAGILSSIQSQRQQ
ncbi:unnamed protein product [Calypogeia fissa]